LLLNTVCRSTPSLTEVEADKKVLAGLKQEISQLHEARLRGQYDIKQYDYDESDF